MRPVQVRATLLEREDGRVVLTVYRDEFGLTKVHANRREGAQWAADRVLEELMIDRADDGEAA